MSYCRFSSDNFTCDVYVYEHVGGYWVIHVAGRRRLPEAPPAPAARTENEDGILSQEESREWLKLHEEWSDKWIHDIDLPQAGELFELESPQTCADKLRELKSIGFNVPQYAIDELEDEVRIK